MTTSTTTETLTLAEAALLTGFSEGKFRYNKQLLIEHGATVTPNGWSIPRSTLTNLGWVGVKPPKTRTRKVDETVVLKLKAENAQLRKELAAMKEEAARKRGGIFSRRRK